ncbi:MAG: methionine--tRNA ligase [Deltaproteobacteria bacterium]|nr:methionine--tRNA ligase [Deltaproteobacteria bacterium]
MNRHFYVTTPIYYVNARPHLGHTYTTVVADTIKRYYQSSGINVFFLTGTDEHGDKVVEAADKEGLPPQEYADMISGAFRATWDKMGMLADDFIRTTEERHKRVVVQFLQQVYDRGDIYFSRYGGNYCFGCERFYLDRELVGGKCPDHQVEPQYIEEENYFFRMSKYQDWLISYIKEHHDFIRPERYRNEVLSFLSEPLEDLCISRPKTRLTWGITLPFDDRFVTYVWFDALINYISALGYPDGDLFHTYWPQANHIIAKDILKPHAIFWPTMLKSAGIEPYRRLNVHGYWNVESHKMSKSLGNVVDPLSLMDTLGLDAFRYFLLRDMVFGLDSNFSHEAVISRYNSDLANDLGNLLSRTLTMAIKYFDGVIPEAGTDNSGTDGELIATAMAATKDYRIFMEDLTFHRALASVWEVIRRSNQYIVENEPWTLVKQGNRLRLSAVIYNCLESLRTIACMVYPVMPQTAEKIFASLGLDPELARSGLSDSGEWGKLPDGLTVSMPEPLFPRIETKEKPAPQVEQKQSPKPKKEKKTKKVVEPPAEIALEDLQKVDLRLAQVISAERVPGADRLLKLEVEAGGRRTVVAGMAEYYTPEEITGKSVVLVANLKPVILKGIESQGMILAAENDQGRLSLLTLDGDGKPGARVR